MAEHRHFGGKVMEAECTAQKPSRRPLDPAAVFGFLWAAFIMVFPLEADSLDVLLRQRRFVIAAEVAGACLAAVAIPYLLTLRRWRREPGMWRGRRLLVATGAILVLNLVFVGAIFAHYVTPGE